MRRHRRVVQRVLALALAALLVALAAANVGGTSRASNRAQPSTSAQDAPAQADPDGLGRAPGDASGDAFAAAGVPSFDRCVDCHPQRSADYAHSAMARAMGPIGAAEARALAGLETLRAGSTGLSYRFEASAGEGARAWIVETYEAAPNGAATAPVRTSAALEFAIGAGVQDRSYVARLWGQWWFAPLEALAPRGQRPRRAAFAPGHAISPGLRFGTPIAEECLACHTDRLPPRVYPRNAVPGPEVGFTPQGISCAACHGAVEAHATWRTRELEGQPNRGGDPILKAASMDPVDQLSVCARCHLQGDARIWLEPGGRGLPPPGGDLLERMAIFVPAHDDGQIPFVSQVERLLASRCASGGLEDRAKSLTCSSCHDPHKSLADAGERARVRRGCLTCHEELETSKRGTACLRKPSERAGRDCVDCHMRRTGVFDVGEVEILDHRIARDPGPPSPRVALRVQHALDGDLAPFTWPGRNPPTWARDAGLASMAAMIAGFPAQAARRVDDVVSDEVRALPTYQHLRGVLLESLGRDREARAAYAEALRLDPGQIDSTINLALVEGRLRDGKAGLERLDRLLELRPRLEGALRNRAVLRYGAADFAGFAADLMTAYAIQPRAAVARTLASWFERQKQPELARTWREEERRLPPDSVR